MQTGGPQSHSLDSCQVVLMIDKGLLWLPKYSNGFRGVITVVKLLAGDSCQIFGLSYLGCQGCQLLQQLS